MDSFWWLLAVAGEYTSRLCCHLARPGQAGELCAEEPDEVQQG